MEFLSHLWLPILVSGVAVWFASALAWMAVGHHKKDRDPIPGGTAGEQEFMDAVRRMNIQPGNYGFPDFCQHDNLRGKEKMEALKALYDRRPMGILRIWGEMNMGTNMLLTFLFYLFTSAVIAYLAWSVMPRGERFGQVFQVVGTAAILAYCFSSFPNDLWFQKKRRAMVMDWIDGIVFGLITAAVFAWLWPK